MGTDTCQFRGAPVRRRAACRYLPALLLLLLAGCGGAPVHPTQSVRPAAPPVRDARPVLPQAAPGDRQPSPVAEIARQMVGAPYRYGGTNPHRGFDCSGLVTYTHRMAGIPVPRTANTQYLGAQPVPRGRLRPGDLVFFSIPGRRNLHVGIYTGDGRFVHAPSAGKRVGVAYMEDPYWSSHYLGAGRYP